jgi:hemoglobin
MQTLYEKIGGAETVDKLVATFYKKVLSDPILMPFFKNTSIEVLTNMQKAFFAVALGGPVPDSRSSLLEAHRGRGIESNHLRLFTDRLLETLLEIGIEQRDAEKVHDRIAAYSKEVLGETPAETPADE